MWWRTPWLNQRGWLLSLAVADALLLLGSYNLIFWWHFQRGAGITGSISAVVLIWLSGSYLLGRYSRPDPNQQHPHWRCLISTTAVMALVLVVVVLVQWSLQVADPRAFPGFIAPVLGCCGLGSGLAQLWLLRRLQRSKHWLLIGSPQELDTLRHELHHHSLREPLTLSTCTPEAVEAIHSGSTPGHGAIALSEMAELSDARVESLLSERSRGTKVCTLVAWSERYLQRVPPELLSNRWLVQAEGFRLQPGRWSWRLKRLGDVVVAALLLLVCTPLLLLAALAIWLEDRGPVLYSQVRTGLYGEPFALWKLRSMHVQAEAGSARWASRGDARITRVGGWLRRLRLDELPQLVAVLKGDMSLIGPRPEQPDIEVMLEQRIPHYRIRHWLRPGLSGWAQVSYPYGASVEDSRIKLSYDLFYLRNAGLLLDLLILIKTIRLVATAQGAIPMPAAPRPPDQR